MSDVSQPAAIRSNLLLLQQTQRQIDNTQTRLATGLKINSALDGPQSFFAAKGLNQRASDLLGLKDAMGQAISTINSADTAVSSIQELIDQARGLTESALQNAGNDPQSVQTRQQLANDFNQIVQAIDDLARDSGYGGRNLAIGDGTVIAADGAGRGEINQIVGLDGTTVTNVAAADTYSVAVSGSGEISGNVTDMAAAEVARGLENLNVFGTQNAENGTYDSISIRVEGGAGQDKTITVSDGTNTRAIQVSADGSDNGTYVFNFSGEDEYNGVALDADGQTVVSGDADSATGAIISFTVDVATIEGVPQTSGVGESVIEKFVDHQVTVSNASGESITRDASRSVGTGRLNNGENAFAFDNGTVRVNVDSAQLQVSAEATQASLGSFTGRDADAVSNFIAGLTQTGLTEDATLDFNIEETRAAAAQEAGQLSAVNSQGNTINSVATLEGVNAVVGPNATAEFTVTLDGEEVTVDTSGFVAANVGEFATQLQDALRAADGNSANLSVAADGNDLVISDSLGRGMRDGVLVGADPDDNITATFSTGAALGGQMANLTADVPVNDERTFAFRVVSQVDQAAANLVEAGTDGGVVMDTDDITAYTHSEDTGYVVTAFNDTAETTIRLRSEDGSFDVTQTFDNADLDGTNIHDFTDAEGRTVSITFDTGNVETGDDQIDAAIVGENDRMGFAGGGGQIEDGAGAAFTPLALAGIIDPAEEQPIEFTLTLDSTSEAFGTEWAAAFDATSVETFSITVDGQTFTSGAAGNTDLEGVAQGIRNQLAGQDGFEGVEVLVEENGAGDERLVVRTTDGSVLNNFELQAGGVPLADEWEMAQGGTYTLTDSYGNSATTYGFDGQDLDFVEFGSTANYQTEFDISFTTVDLSDAVVGEQATFTMTPAGAYQSSFDIEAGETIVEVSDGTGPAVRLTNEDGGENLAGLNTQASAMVNGVEVSFELLDSAQVQPGGRVAQTVTGETTTELSITVSDGTNTGVLANVTSQFAGGEIELGDATLNLAFNRANIDDAGEASRAESSITNVYSVMGSGTNGAVAVGDMNTLSFTLGEQDFSIDVSGADNLTMADTIASGFESQAQAAGFDASGVEFSFSNGTLTMTDTQGRGFTDVEMTANTGSAGPAVTTAEGRPAGLEASVEVTQGDEISRDVGTRTIVGGTSNNDLFVTFNERRTSVIQVQAINLQTDGTGLRIDRAANGWQDVADIERSVAALDNATNALRSASSSFSTALNIVTARETFTEEFSNVLQDGADKLVLADPNEEGANMLTLQTRQQLGTISLSIANQSQQAILRLF